MITQKTISLQNELWKEIDRTRGDVSRSRYIAKILADSLNKSTKKLQNEGEICA